MGKRIIIAGSRLFDDYAKLRQYCNYYLRDADDATVISGGARGADALGERYALERGFKLERYPADWDRYGKSAGYIRNERMAEVADTLIEFKAVGAENKGTNHMISIARRKGLEVYVVE